MLEGKLTGMVSVAQITQCAYKEMNKVNATLEGNDAIPADGSRQAEPKITVRVKLGRTDERIFEFEQGTKVSRVLEIFAAERGCDRQELILFREGESQPLTLDVEIVTDYPHKRFHHIHYLREVNVTVYYQDSQDSRVFKRFKAVKDVLTWAINAFNIDASLATELVMVRHGEKDELPEREHIGHLAGRDCDLALDLVRGDIANGGSPC